MWKNGQNFLNKIWKTKDFIVDFGDLSFNISFITVLESLVSLGAAQVEILLQINWK